MLEIVNSCDVIVVCINCDIRVYALQRACGCVDLAEAGLVRLEEQPVHVGQFNFVVIKEDKLEKQSLNLSSAYF